MENWFEKATPTQDASQGSSQSMWFDNVASNTPTSQALQAGADPKTVEWARANMDDGSYNNWCLKFVDDAMGLPASGRSPSAISAWNSPDNKKVSGLEGIKPGDAVFFDSAPSNGGDGHTAIYSGNNRIISGSHGEQDINEWSTNNNQPILGYMPADQFKGGNN